MEKTVKIDVKQREHLADLLNDARNREREQLEQANPVSEESITRELLKEEGGDKLLKEIDEANSKIQTLKEILAKNERQLKDMGFELDGSDITLRWDASHSLREDLHKRLALATAPVEKSLKKYATATALVWAATNPEELHKAIDGLI